MLPRHGFLTGQDWVNSHGGIRVGNISYPLRIDTLDDQLELSIVYDTYNRLIYGGAHLLFLPLTDDERLTEAAIDWGNFRRWPLSESCLFVGFFSFLLGV